MRDLALIERIAARHDVTLAALCRSGEQGRLDGLGNICRVAEIPLGRGMRPGFGYATRASRAAFADVARRERWDLVQIEHSFLASYLGAVPAGPRTVISLHNVGSQQYQSMRRSATGAGRRAAFAVKQSLIAWHERRWLPRFDLALTVSEHDDAVVRALYPGLSTAVVPNGVDTQRIKPLPDSGGARLLFVGNLLYRPNADAVERFAAEDLPRIHGAGLRVVGEGAADRLAAMPGVKVAGQVAGLEREYRDATVCVVPLLAGGGTRLKILEAMAYGRAVVSTPVGAEGLEVEDGRHLLIAEAGEPFARAVERLLGDAGLRTRLATAARRRVEQRYGWHLSAGALERAHDTLAVR